MKLINQRYIIGYKSRELREEQIGNEDLIMKKLLVSLLVTCLLGLNISPAFAITVGEIRDISAQYWASKEIVEVVSDEIMYTDGTGRFNPEADITRAEFVTALLKVLNNANLAVVPNNNYLDIVPSDPYYNDIMRSDSLDLVHGYPDGNFRPNQAMLRSECVAVISHITKDATPSLAILNQFGDREAIPSWAINQYAKTITYGIYVNHPDTNMLEPNRNLTRAEAAVILYRLKQKLGYVKPEYVGKQEVPAETVIRTEHLHAVKNTPNDKVKITNYRQIIERGNAFVVAFDEKFLSKQHKAGDIVNFVLPQALYTDEGTKLLPAGTRIVAEILKIDKPRCCNKNARVHLIFNRIVMPDGTSSYMAGKPFTSDYTLKEGPWMTFWKVFASTIGFGAIGGGAGAGFAFIPNPAKLGVGLGVGIPVGCAIGLITGLITPGLNYRAKKGELVPVLLLDDASINDTRN